MKRVLGLMVLLFFAGQAASADTDMYAMYISWDKAGTVISGPFHSSKPENPIESGRSTCGGRYPPYSVRFVSTTTNKEHTFVCEEVNAQK